jgi:hypothetical protein
MSCNAEFGTCTMDDRCNECFENPSRPDCDDNEAYGALIDCICVAEACLDVCDVLFCTSQP